MKTRAIMIQGTGSGAGKSLIVTALCRIWRDAGHNVAPFKAQNMALNSFVTRDGAEIGRAQALQAEAARIEPSADMNPVLLKTSGETGSQVILQGRVHSSMSAAEYYRFRETAWRAVQESWARLSARHDLIVLEGAGSPAEINLRDVDIVNMAMAREARAPVLLIGDIDRGGVFASLAGTIGLLGREARYCKGFIINKFRGDREILAPGLDLIEKKTGRPVLGVLPYITDIGLPEEDSLSLAAHPGPALATDGTIRIVVIRLPFISNFTDFDPFLHEPDAEVIFSRNHTDILNADIIILPGTKKTLADLDYLHRTGLAAGISGAHRKGITVIGIGGGFQMMGLMIADPYQAESERLQTPGLGLLPVEAVFDRSKVTSQVEAVVLDGKALPFRCRQPLRGYEIHPGISRGEIGLFRVTRLSGGGDPPGLDGAKGENCWGTYLHGIFENDDFRRGLINQARRKKGLPEIAGSVHYARLKDRAIDNLAKVIRENLAMHKIEAMIGL